MCKDGSVWNFELLGFEELGKPIFLLNLSILFCIFLGV